MDQTKTSTDSGRKVRKYYCACGGNCCGEGPLEWYSKMLEEFLAKHQTSRCGPCSFEECFSALMGSFREKFPEVANTAVVSTDGDLTLKSLPGLPVEVSVSGGASV